MGVTLAQILNSTYVCRYIWGLSPRVHNFSTKSSAHARDSALNTTLTASTRNSKFYPKTSQSCRLVFYWLTKLSSVNWLVKVQTRRTKSTWSSMSASDSHRGRGLMFKGGVWTFNDAQTFDFACLISFEFKLFV